MDILSDQAFAVGTCAKVTIWLVLFLSLLFPFQKLRTSLHTVNLQDVYVLFYMREDKQIDILKNPALKSDDKDKVGEK